MASKVEFSALKNWQSEATDDAQSCERLCVSFKKQRICVYFLFAFKEQNKKSKQGMNRNYLSAAITMKDRGYWFKTLFLAALFQRSTIKDPKNEI